VQVYLDVGQKHISIYKLYTSLSTKNKKSYILFHVNIFLIRKLNLRMKLGW